MPSVNFENSPVCSSLNVSFHFLLVGFLVKSRLANSASEINKVPQPIEAEDFKVLEYSDLMKRKNQNAYSGNDFVRINGNSNGDICFHGEPHSAKSHRPARRHLKMWPCLVVTKFVSRSCVWAQYFFLRFIGHLTVYMPMHRGSIPSQDLIHKSSTLWRSFPTPKLSVLKSAVKLQEVPA